MASTSTHIRLLVRELADPENWDCGECNIPRSYPCLHVCELTEWVGDGNIYKLARIALGLPLEEN